MEVDLSFTNIALAKICLILISSIPRFAELLKEKVSGVF